MTIDDIPETPGLWLPGGEWQVYGNREQWLRSNMTERVARLFAVASARSVHCLLPADEKRPRIACDVAERFADGNATREELAASDSASASAAASAASAAASASAAYASAAASAASAAASAAAAAASAASAASAAAASAAASASATIATYSYSSAAAPTRLNQSRLLTLYMPRHWNPRWSTDATRQLAEIIYTEKAYDRVPILCDALMDADCDDEELLTWLRGLPVETWQRGTWILDILTGRRGNRR